MKGGGQNCWGVVLPITVYIRAIYYITTSALAILSAN